MSKSFKMRHLLHPFTALVSGPSFAGKTSLVVDILNNSRDIINVNFEKIIWCYAEKNSIKSVLNNLNSEQRGKIEFVQGVPEEIPNTNSPILVVLDDLMTESASSKRVADLFTRQAHHLGISCFVLVQNLFNKGKWTRDISLNAKYIIHFKSPRDSQQFGYLARQIYPENSSDLVRVYKEICNQSHGYIFFDLCQDTHNLLRFKTNILDKNYTVIYCPLDSDKSLEHEEIKGEPAYIIRVV